MASTEQLGRLTPEADGVAFFAAALERDLVAALKEAADFSYDAIDRGWLHAAKPVSQELREVADEIRKSSRLWGGHTSSALS